MIMAGILFSHTILHISTTVSTRGPVGQCIATQGKYGHLDMQKMPKQWQNTHLELQCMHSFSDCPKHCTQNNMNITVSLACTNFNIHHGIV